jgi:hypothetical protein
MPAIITLFLPSFVEIIPTGIKEMIPAT